MTQKQAEKSLINHKNIYSPFMTIAYDLKGGFAEEIPGAVHPADKTARPQMLSQKDNPSYHHLLEEFGKITGIECLLNTSFNLHGDPIVESPLQAIETFSKTDIDILLFDSVAIQRKNDS